MFIYMYVSGTNLYWGIKTMLVMTVKKMPVVKCILVATGMFLIMWILGIILLV